MHFVGNRAITLGDGNSNIQLDYNPGFTALSAFLPIIFLFFALSLFELRQPSDRSFWPILVFAGFIAGFSITGMHYVGNFGISNYQCHNPAAYVIGAAAIAIVASIVALSLFFYFREKWVNSFPKRMASSALLAGAVSGMHWLASIGTTYTLKKAVTWTKDTRNINLIVAIICVSIKTLLYRGSNLTYFRLFFAVQYVLDLPSSLSFEGNNLQTELSMLCSLLQHSITKDDFLLPKRDYHHVVK
jgi:NO-binding membrane sensor protein with MHYT domain